MIEYAAPDDTTASDLRDAKYSAAAAVRSLFHAYQAPLSATTAVTPADGITVITKATEIEALAHGRELIVDGTVFKVSRTDGCQTYVRDLPGIDFMHPAQFIEMFREAGILIRS
ncbi:hypothetical protein GM708_07580 [Vibrio cholerae]|nr:hypothetical protein [Vibrio cholerae]